MLRLGTAIATKNYCQIKYKFSMVSRSHAQAKKHNFSKSISTEIKCFPQARKALFLLSLQALSFY
jgi:hypothetical protein